jgi:branched-chain amino acid transport system ATP-binding protein
MSLRVEGLSSGYGDLQVLWDVSIEVGAGEIVTVIGSNGAGKTTLLRNVSRLSKPWTGAITFDGVDLTRLEAHQVVELGLIQIPEARRIFPEMTVDENLLVGGYSQRARPHRAGNLERVFSLFPRLRERRRQLGGTMSGGEQQMLAIARGLMGSPRLLILDEPSLGLSPLMVRTIFDVIGEINRLGVTILLVEQNVNQSLRIAGRAYVLETGRVSLSGTGAALRNDEHVRRAYLGL